MKCPRCHHKNRSAAKFCDECGQRLPRYRRRRHTTQNEAAVAILVVLAGAALIVGIVMASPRWHMIIATWRENSATWLAKMSPAGTLADRAIRPTGDAPALGEPAAAVRQEPARGAELQSRERPLRAPNLAPSGQSGSGLQNSTQARDLTRLAPRSPTGTTIDDAQVMGRLLIGQLGEDTARRTALANAQYHALGSPEFVYWHRVAAAIRNGGPQPGR